MKVFTETSSARTEGGGERGEAFDVFLSHNSQDKPVVRELAGALKARGLRVWLDEEQLVPGRVWQEELETIIRTTRAAAVLIGRSGLGPWEKPEMRGCLDEFVNRGSPVIPVLLPDAPAKPELPLFLRGITWVDFRNGLTEVALERLEWGIRGEKSGRSPRGQKERPSGPEGRKDSVQIGPYRHLKFIGQGGMGKLYRAVHERLGREVAIKVLSNPDSRAVQRFLNEARIHATLHHPHIATLYEFLEHEGRPCIVMEYVDGQTLAERLAGNPLSLTEALGIVKAVAEAIGYVHDHGIVHRDISSDNIKVNRANEVKLLDFGIAQDAATPNLTTTLRAIGNIAYMAPERLEGRPADSRSDIWALGVLLYELIAGQSPFTGSSLPEISGKVARAQYLPLRHNRPWLPPPLETIVAKCLERRPERRYGSGREFLKDICHLIAALYPEGVTPPQKRQRAPFPRPAVYAVSALVLLLLVGGGVAYYWKGSISLSDSPPYPPGQEKVIRIELEREAGEIIVVDNGKNSKTEYARTWKTSQIAGQPFELKIKRDHCEDYDESLQIQIDDPEEKVFWIPCKPKRGPVFGQQR